MIVLVRHGRTASNASGVLQGRVDNALDDVGHAQAAAIAAALRNELAAGPVGEMGEGGGAIDVVVSPLRRAVETAVHLRDHLDVGAIGDWRVDPRWMEADYGVYDDRPLRDVPRDVWDAWRGDPGFRPPGGESLAEVSARVEAACAELDPARTTVVFTHVGAIKAAVAWALGVGPSTTWRMRVDQASLHRIGSAVGGGPVLLSFNDTAHLAVLAAPGPTT